MSLDAMNSISNIKLKNTLMHTCNFKLHWYSIGAISRCVLVITTKSNDSCRTKVLKVDIRIDSLALKNSNRNTWRRPC